MQSILIVDTGGTFNKYYNSIKGSLEVVNDASYIKTILASFYNLEYTLISIINKDSLDFTNDDRKLLCDTLVNASQNKIIVVHGTDTMNLSAQYLQKKNVTKSVVLTGSMVPFSINSVEATANFSMCVGYLLHSKCAEGIYIGMHGAIEKSEHLIKNRERGIFERHL